jgi:hypothetical protein
MHFFQDPREVKTRSTAELTTILLGKGISPFVPVPTAKADQPELKTESQEKIDAWAQAPHLCMSEFMKNAGRNFDAAMELYYTRATTRGGDSSDVMGAALPRHVPDPSDKQSFADVMKLRYDHFLACKKEVDILKGTIAIMHGDPNFYRKDIEFYKEWYDECVEKCKQAKLGFEKATSDFETSLAGRMVTDQAMLEFGNSCPAVFTKMKQHQLELSRQLDEFKATLAQLKLN